MYELVQARQEKFQNELIGAPSLPSSRLHVVDRGRMAVSGLLMYILGTP